MISQVNSLIISKPKAVLTKNNTSFYGQAVSIPLEQKDGKDVVAINKKSKLSKKQKTWIKIGTVVATVAAIAVTAREIFIKKAQKVFQEAFLRDDINRKETINILNRYREVAKIKDKNEYIKAVYEEGKKNFGLKNLKLKLSISKMDKKNVVGSYNSTKALLKINEEMHRKDVIDTLHHELRHVKQDFLMANYSPKEFASAKMWASGGLYQLQSNNERSIEAVYTCYFNNHGIIRDPSVVPQKLEDYVKKLIKAQRDYVESNIVDGKINQEYYNNFKEVDARKCGESIDRILKWIKFWK